MADPTLNRATLRNKFELEKFRSKVVKGVPEMESSPSNCSQKQKAAEIEELVRHMKHLPSYLESGKPIPDRALSFGVMDWARLEKWQNKYHKNGLVRSNKWSPSSSNSSSLFSTDGSSPRSSRDRSCSPARQKGHRITLQSHFEASPKEDFTGNADNIQLQYFQDLRNQSKSILVTESLDTPPSSCLKGMIKNRGKTENELEKVQDSLCRTRYDHYPEKQENGNNNLNPGRIQTEAANRKNARRILDFSRNQGSPSRNKTPERKRSGSSDNPDLKTTNNSVSKPRSISPLRRFSFSLSTSSKPESSTPQSSTMDTERAHSSPLRRLLDPIFPSKTHQFVGTGHEDSRTKAKVKLDFKKETQVDDVPSQSSRKQALFQTTVKNDRLLFTFAVEDNKEILAATVTSLSPLGKDDNKNLLYTFFTVHEVKKKNVSWLSQGSKSKDNGYVPNVTAQMKVTNSHCDTREFVLYAMNSNVQPQDEMEAIVVKFPRKVNGDNNQESFSTTVILPGGTHGVPSNGKPTPLIDRWRSGGGCDCEGWDIGCTLNTLSKPLQSTESRSNKVHTSFCSFELFFQGEVMNKKPSFRLSTLKEGIFSIDFNSSLSPLQAFSICISVVESQKLSQNRQRKIHIHGEAPKKYTPIPGIKKNTVGKISAS
uniref:uncharacterized protein LOC122593292 n=1 Tax=Erigeron canadensis TaxID=72917 RepID=UPI001CB8CFA3|nr:uncharacterized protein LOC122593292 [Erigeron canadensis]